MNLNHNLKKATLSPQRDNILQYVWPWASPLNWGVFLKKSNTLSTTPNPIPIPNPINPPFPIPKPIPNTIDPLTLYLDLAPPPNFFIFLHSPGFELQTSDFEVHLHLHYATQAIVANLFIFVALISYWSQTHPSPLTQINLV